MDENMYRRLRDTCNKFQERKIKYIYLYPFGCRGFEIYNFIKNVYHFEKIIIVDNELSKHNSSIIEFSSMIKDSRLEEGVVLLTSDKPDIYRELRLSVEGVKLLRGKIVDLFNENPLVYAKDGRLAALTLVSKQIYNNQVEGCIAEAGVYQGDFAKYMNILFPDRRLYLFDTFQGFKFDQVDDQLDNMEQTNLWIDALKDTTVDIVLNKMRYKEQVIIKRGVFPYSAKDVKEKFAFVNLDMDIYHPTYEGLNFFWEKMNSGGYIFVHDFDIWDGVNAAVLQFCKEKNTSYVCLNDGATVCIAKPMN